MPGGERLGGRGNGGAGARVGCRLRPLLHRRSRHWGLVDFKRPGRLEPAVRVPLGVVLERGHPGGDFGGVGLALGEGGDFLAGAGILLLEVGARGLHLGREGGIVVHAPQLRLRRVIVVGVDAPLFHVGEEGLQGIEVGRLDRVELVVVAFGAAKGRAQPSGRDGTDPFGAVFGKVFLGLGAAFAGHHVEAVVAGRHFLFFGRARQQVAGKLLPRERIEGLVGVEGLDHVIAVGEDPLVLVAMEADGVGEAGDIQPPHRHAFTEVRRGQ